MTLRIALLTSLLVFSAMALVQSRYQERRLYAEMEKLEKTNQKLQSDIENLQVQRLALGTPARIDSVVRDRLGMVPIRPSETLQYSKGSTQ